MKTALSFAFGPTREDGRLVLRREDVLAQARYFEAVVGLDYGQLEERWDGRGWLAVAGAAELRHQFRLTFADPPLGQASAHRVDAARALRYLYEHETERFSVKVETELPKKVALDLTVPRRGDWLPESLHEPVRELLARLARRELAALIETHILASDTAARVSRRSSTTEPRLSYRRISLCFSPPRPLMASRPGRSKRRSGRARRDRAIWRSGSMPASGKPG